MSEVNFDFTGKNFLVVGASSGMGRQTALELAAANAHVLAVARNEERLKKLCDKFPDLIEFAILDVTKATGEDWEKVLGEFVQRHGKISGEVYTAGTGVETPLKIFDESAARNVMETGFWGAIKSLQTATRKKFANPGSSYVIFSSVAGHVGQGGGAVYAATKAAVRVAAKSFAKDLAKNFHRINTISPGWVKTEMTDKAEVFHPAELESGHLLGFLNPDDVTGTVLFLLSDRAKKITGSDFIIDSGYTSSAF